MPCTLNPPRSLTWSSLTLGWTPQKLALPAGLKWIEHGHIITLVKPHYELTEQEKRDESVAKGLSEKAIQRTLLQRVKETCKSLNLEICGETISPIKGKKSSRKGDGNSEYLLLLKTPLTGPSECEKHSIAEVQ